MQNNNELKNNNILRQKAVYRILVVDDDPDITLAFKIGLEQEHNMNDDFIGNDSDSCRNGRFVVCTFNDPLLALSSFKDNDLSLSSKSSSVQSSPYDLLLLDISMPKMNGFDLYQEIIKISEKDIKTCFITAFEVYYESLKKDFPLLDVGCFIKKPIGINDLRNRIKAELME